MRIGIYIVMIGDTRHSAWYTRFDSNHQKKVLEMNGYKNVRVILDVTVNCEDGHYYI